MLIFAIDDEPKMLRRLHKTIAVAAPETEIRDYLLGAEAMRSIREDGLHPDVVFSDIEMPGLSGLELAVQLKKAVPDAKLVFVTGYDYAMEAYRLHVNGYIAKPVEAERIREELDYAFPPPPPPPEPDKLSVQCFGSFEVFWIGQPLAFHRKQSKELLAYLVDRRGASCTAEEIIAAIWGDERDMKSAKQRLRNLVSDLKTTLLSVGFGDVLIRQGSSLAIRKSMVDCDYFRMLAGDMDAVNAFRGEYMEQYSWAELTKGILHFQKLLP